MSDAELLSIQYQTLFVTTASGRIQRENDPDHSPGPRFWLAGCSTGNVAGVRADVADSVAAEIMALVATEPPLVAPGRNPEHLDRFIQLLSGDRSSLDVPAQKLGTTCQLPHDLEYQQDARVTLIDSDTEEGKQLHASLGANGLPDDLVNLGFHGVWDFWPPWCVALREGEIASIAFAARLGDTGAELGVATVHAHRGRGYAAAATAGWSRLESLRSRALFYSTDEINHSSKRVMARLRLRLLGASLRLI